MKGYLPVRRANFWCKICNAILSKLRYLLRGIMLNRVIRTEHLVKCVQLRCGRDWADRSKFRKEIETNVKKQRKHEPVSSQDILAEIPMINHLSISLRKVGPGRVYQSFLDPLFNLPSTSPSLCRNIGIGIRCCTRWIMAIEFCWHNRSVSST